MRGIDAVATLSRENVHEHRRLFIQLQKASRSPRTQRALRDGYAQRIMHEREVWTRGLKHLSDHFHEHLAIDAAVTWAMAEWKAKPKKRRLLWKADDSPPPDDWTPNEEELRRMLWASIAGDALARGALMVYLNMVIRTSDAAGQNALDHLGIHKTWAWANPQNMANDAFAVRGSKVIQQLYGDHVDRLAQLILTATDPANPMTIQQVRAEIKTAWPQLQAYQVDRIARTETAAVWTSTSRNAYVANGISEYESSIATGPSIGIDSEDPCDECVEAADSVHSMDDDIPPWHPNCRCEIIPVLEGEDGSEWLPPAEPFTGGADSMDVGPETFAESDAAYSDLQDGVEQARRRLALKRVLVVG